MKALVIRPVAMLATTTDLQGQPKPVMTQYGRVKGVTEEDLTVYRGIPFAQPPDSHPTRIRAMAPET